MTRQTIARLSQRDREKLIEASRHTIDAATSQRLLIVAKLADGERQGDVARALLVARSTVSFTLAKFHVHGERGLYDQRRGNGQTKADRGFLDHLCELLQGTPGANGWQRTTWSRELLCKQMELDGYPQVSLSTMGRALRKLGARRGNPKPVVSCPWPTALREQRISEIRALERRPRHASRCSTSTRSISTSIHEWAPTGCCRVSSGCC